MKIPVFVSCPTALNTEQEATRKIISKELDKNGLELRQLGKSDYPTEFPLKEVYSIAKHCSGGIILGFEQLKVNSGVWKIGTKFESKISTPIYLPSAWNNLEAGILFSLNLPLLVFKEDGISGGIFDNGVTDVFIHKMPTCSLSKIERKAFSSIFVKWQSSVRNNYYS